MYFHPRVGFEGKPFTVHSRTGSVESRKVTAEVNVIGLLGALPTTLAVSDAVSNDEYALIQSLAIHIIPSHCFHPEGSVEPNSISAANTKINAAVPTKQDYRCPIAAQRIVPLPNLRKVINAEWLVLD
jgi:hypothetical protein